MNVFIPWQEILIHPQEGHCPWSSLCICLSPSGSVSQPIQAPPPGSHLAVRLKTAADSPSVKLNLPSTSREGLESGLRKEQREQAGFTLDEIHLKGTGSPEDMENSLAGLASRLCWSLSGAQQPGR